MKTLPLTIVILLFSAPRAFAHEEGTEITNVAESDWVGPLIAIIVIVGAIIIARTIRARPARQRSEPKAMAGGSSANNQMIHNNQTKNS